MGVWGKSGGSAGPCTSCGGCYKAYCVIGQQWRTWLGLWGRRGQGAGRGWVAGGRAGRETNRGNVWIVSEAVQTFRSKERRAERICGK